MESIEEKIEKLEQRLAKMKEERASMDEKIQKKEKEIQKYKDILNQRKFNEMTEVLSVKGITMDELIQNIKNGTIDVLKEKVN